MATVVVTLALTPASAANAADEKTPSAKQVAKVAVKDQGPDAIIDAFLALDRGYLARQLVDGALDHSLESTGEISDAEGAPVAPAGPPAGVVTDAPAVDGPGEDVQPPVSIDALRDAVPKKRRIAVQELTDIIVAAARGYTVEEVIVDGFLDGGFAPGFRQPGLIQGIPKPGEPPEPDLLDDLLVGIAKKPEPKDKGDTDDATFSGVLVLGANWADTQGVGTPTLDLSLIELRIKSERLVGTYLIELTVPPEGGANCATSATYEGKLDLPSDGPGWTGTATGTWTWTVRADCPAPGVYGLNWQVSVLQVSDNRLSGEFSAPSDSQGMTMTFEARAA